MVDLLAFASDLNWFEDTFFRNWGTAGAFEIFGSKRWDSMGRPTVAVILAVVAITFLIIERRARRMKLKGVKLWAKPFGIFLMVFGFFTYFDFFNPNVRYHDYYHRHEFYHYYLGAKYSEELGYQHLYECTMIAEIDLGRDASVRKRKIRDLRDNLIKPSLESAVYRDPDSCKKRFSSERWQDFKTDITWFERSAHGDYWEGMQKDHGYNPPPLWTMTGKFFSNMAPAGDTFFKLLACLDISIHIAVLGLFAWAFGWRVAMIGAVFWGINSPASFYWTGGAFLRQDWILFGVAAICCARKRHFYLAGFFMIWAGLLRVFPLAFSACWIFVILWDTWRKRRLDLRFKKVLIGMALALATLVPASNFTTGGGWSTFLHHISLHRSTPLTNQMGLPAMLAHSWEGRMQFLRDEGLDDPFEVWKDTRTERYTALKPLWYAILLGLCLWFAWACLTMRQLWLAPAMMLAIATSVTNSTCYYYAMFLFAIPLARAHPAMGPFMIALAASSRVVLGRFHWIDDSYIALSWLFYIAALYFLWLHSRPLNRKNLQKLLSFLKREGKASEQFALSKTSLNKTSDSPKSDETSAALSEKL